MRRFFVALLVLVSCSPAMAQGVQMVPLERYLQLNDASKDNTLRYVYMRCSSLYLVLTALTSGDKDLQTTSKRFAIRSERMTATAKTLIPGHDEFVRTQMLIMVNEYSTKAQTSRALTGNSFDDPSVRGDTEFCKGIPD